jgi:catechol 2,3-dioxygenase-like lactoylglutathione lyase family enzyme
MAGTPEYYGNPEIGFILRDIEASTPFYRDGLGLQHLEDFDGPAGLQRRFRCGDGAILKLMKLPEPPTIPAHPGGIFGGAVGVRWITLAVDDIDEVVARCVAAGGSVGFPITEWAPGRKAACVEDPEGSCWIELSWQSKE